MSPHQQQLEDRAPVTDEFLRGCFAGVVLALLVIAVVAGSIVVSLR